MKIIFSIGILALTLNISARECVPYHIEVDVLIASCDELCLYISESGSDEDIIMDHDIITETELELKESNDVYKISYSNLSLFDNIKVKGTIDFISGTGLIIRKKSGRSPFDGFSSSEDEYELNNCLKH